MPYRLAAEVALWLVWSLTAMAVTEYLAHRYPMHRRYRVMPWAFERHAVTHHKHKDRNTDNPIWWALLLTSVVWLPVALAGEYAGAACVAAVVAGHAWAWTRLHRAIHGVGSGWVRRVPGYATLAGHHLTHHARPTRNFGGLFGPVTDRVFGTLYRGDN